MKTLNKMNISKVKIENMGLQRKENNFIVQCNFSVINNITFYRTSRPDIYTNSCAVAIFKIKIK